MQRKKKEKLLQSYDYCWAVNTIKRIIMKRKHRVEERLTRVYVSTQGFLSPAVEDTEAAGCCSVHSAAATGSSFSH